MDEKRVAVVIGGTGLVGRELLSSINGFSKIVSISRRPLQDIKCSMPIEQVVINFESNEDLKNVLKGTDLFYCFGSTLKKAGSKENFIRIEWDLTKSLLEIARQNGFKRVYLVSSVGANSNSPFLYPRIKGMIEDLVSSLGFESVAILRPSFLVGDRQEHRSVEKIFIKGLGLISPFMQGPLRSYKPISAKRVAENLLALSHSANSGVRVYENMELQ